MTLQNANPVLEQVRLADLISALSYALDLTEGQPAGHAQRCCVWGMRLAECAGLRESERNDLYYALLLKDAGCGSNAARMYEVLRHDGDFDERAEVEQSWKGLSWEGVRQRLAGVFGKKAALERMLEDGAAGPRREKGEDPAVVAARSEKGMAIATGMGFSAETAQAIGLMDEHWDGSGGPRGWRGEKIPVAARLLALAQTLERFQRTTGMASALAAASRRSGRWFDPGLVRAAHIVAQQPRLEHELENARETVVRMAPAGGAVAASEEQVDRICEGFAEVVDAKSPFTSTHSRRVTEAAGAMAVVFGLDAEAQRLLKRAALLHDLGKLAVPTAILEKPGRLTAEEWQVVKAHPQQSEEILKRIPGFEAIAQVAGAHHERLDGKGYYRGLAAETMDQSMRILAVADVYDALAAKRPYRQAMEREDVFRILSLESRTSLDGECVEALRQCRIGGSGLEEGLRRLDGALGQ